MWIYLDSRDLITLVERKSPNELARFIDVLSLNDATLLLSMHNVVECAAPLVHGGTDTNVMRTLNAIERLPHDMVAEARIEALELAEAVDAFEQGREYRDIVFPIVSRFDYVVSAFHPPSAAHKRDYGIGEVIFDLWRDDPALLAGYPDEGKRLRGLLQKDRERPDYRRHAPNFRNTIGRNLRLYGIAFAGERVPQLADWIYERPTRCPAKRLGYEVFHQILRNVTDSGAASDIPDFAHISCVPYADVVTLDNRMRGYVAQADRALGTEYSEKIVRNVDEVEAALLGAERE